MSRRTRNPFVKVSDFFKQRFDPSRSTSSLSSTDTAAAGPASVQSPTQLTTPLNSRPLNMSTPASPSIADAPSAELVPTQAPRPPISTPSRPSTPSAVLSAISLPMPPSLQQCPAECEMDLSGITVSSAGCDPSPRPPPNLAPRPPTPRLTPSPSALHAPTPRVHGPNSFAGAHDFNLYNPQFVDNYISLGRPGLKELLKHSMPDAFHNSAARYPPPKCYLGTRNGYITKITDWALGSSDHYEPILWMHGPFGIGKSAIAQSCAEALQSRNKLAATLFFSRSNTDRDDPRRVFTSIAYQIATLCEPFSDIVNARICKDPALAIKSLSTQFEELLVYPLTQIGNARGGIEGRVVIIDGLDECHGSSEQCEIIEIIAASARNQTTPFRWFITSRPEDTIIQTMYSDDVSPVLFHFELPVSREVDHEILTYLTDEFEKIRKRHRLPKSWASEEALALLVDRAAGLWIYASTIVRFVMDKNSFGPEDQLRIVVEFAKSVSAKIGEDNPLAEMDLFYTLIMRQVPQKISITVRKILLLYSVYHPEPQFIAPALGLSEERFRRSCTSIQSVVDLQGSDLKSMRFHFYHASFLDFMKDPERSKELCIYGDFLIGHRRERLDWLHRVCSLSTGPQNIRFPSDPVPLEGRDRNWYYCRNMTCFLNLCCALDHPFDFRTAASLEKLQFQMILRLMGAEYCYLKSRRRQRFRANLPIEFQDKIFREDKCPTPGCTNTNKVWILGHGENETVALRDNDGVLKLKNNQDILAGVSVGLELRRAAVKDMKDHDIHAHCQHNVFDI